MTHLSLEHSASLLHIAASRTQRLGNRSCGYAVLTASETQVSSGAMPQLELGVLHYVDADGSPLLPGELSPLEPEQTKHGKITYIDHATQPPDVIKGGKDTIQFLNIFSTRSSEEQLRSLAAALLSRPDILIDAAWIKGMAYDARRLYAGIYLPGDTTPLRMRTLMALQGFKLDEAGQLIVDSPHKPSYSGLQHIVHYTTSPPPMAA